LLSSRTRETRSLEEITKRRDIRHYQPCYCTSPIYLLTPTIHAPSPSIILTLSTSFCFPDTMKASIPNISLKIEFGGGLELLFSNQRSIKINIPSFSHQDLNDSEEKPTNINHLIHWLKEHLLTERAELFIENGTV
jgi:Urm1 (Ubiquitin related modifier)